MSLEHAPQRQAGGVLINRREARRRAGDISRTTEHRLIHNDPTWPMPVQITAGLTGYYLSELQTWIEARPRTVEHLDPEAEPLEARPLVQAEQRSHCSRRAREVARALGSGVGP